MTGFFQTFFYFSYTAVAAFGIFIVLGTLAVPEEWNAAKGNGARRRGMERGEGEWSAAKGSEAPRRGMERGEGE